ncbi:hypothetical protein PPACK8108_LOCUS23841 [Phakopsora pachyrhizi]|uniref:Uncharacterized protein n=1 Tax=Phakopsora pachyrhizi TaxID=170000 RepID=A0AAV0BR21_PHAPC|nr:hypothetical protein PPACK8108_LOCUS23841 [Phakopsora pachyrhizi]
MPVIDTSRDRRGRLPKAGTSGLRKGRNRRKGDVDIAGPTTANEVRGRAGGRAGCTVTGSGGDVRIDNCRADKGKNTLWRNKDCLTDKEAVGREEAGGRPEEVSVGLVRRQETPRRLKDQRRTDIGGISKAVVGRAVNLLNKARSRRARRWHTEVRPSYHFRVSTKVNSTPVYLSLNLNDTDRSNLF